MPEIDHIEAQRRFKRLPKDVQDAMTAPEAAQDIREIARRCHLDDYSTSVFADEVGWIMLGAKPLERLSHTLQRKLGVVAQTAESIAQDAEQKIFAPIRGHIQRIYQEFDQDNERLAAKQNRDEGRREGSGTVSVGKSTELQHHSTVTDPYLEPTGNETGQANTSQSQQDGKDDTAVRPENQPVKESLDAQLLRRARSKVEQPEKQAPAPTNLPIAEKTPETNSSVGDRPAQNNQPDPYREQS